MHGASGEIMAGFNWSWNIKARNVILEEWMCVLSTQEHADVLNKGERYCGDV